MGEALFDLEHVLRSRKDRITLQEANMLMKWKADAMRDLTVGFAGGGIVTWLATMRLRNIFRVNITLGAAAACGIWRFGRSVESSVEHILSLEGSHIQHEFANILLKKFPNDPHVLQHLSKRFYSEKVYVDSSDAPIHRWRYRNSSGDPITHSESTFHTSEETHPKENNVKKPTMDLKQGYANAAGDSMENPFDFIFGYPAKMEDIPSHPDTPSRRQRRKDKRSRHRHRSHHREESDD